MNEIELNPYLRPPSEDSHIAMTESDLCGANNTTNIGENKSQNCSGQVICSDTECSLQEDERISRTRLSSTSPRSIAWDPRWFGLDPFDFDLVSGGIIYNHECFIEDDEYHFYHPSDFDLVSGGMPYNDEYDIEDDEYHFYRLHGSLRDLRSLYDIWRFLDSLDIGLVINICFSENDRLEEISSVKLDTNMSNVRKASLMEEIIAMKLELLKLDTNMSTKKKTRLMEEVMQESLIRIKRILPRHLQTLMVAIVAYLLFCAVVPKAVLKKQSLMKYSFVLAALFILWTSGDVEKHPGPWSILVFASIRALLTRLVKHLQGTTVANWGIEPPFWNRNIVFKDINKITDSDNAEKYAMFYAALQATITKFGSIPDWCREEMVFVETGNEAELQKCQTARKVRDLLKPYRGQDVDDILRRAGHPRQTGNPPLPAAASPTQPSSSTVVRHQRPQKCPYNVPGYRPITDITDAATAGLIAEGCMAQSKNAGKIRSNPSNKRQATTNAIAPAPKQRRLTTNQIPTATVSLSTQPGQPGTVSQTLAFIIPVPALTVTASPSGVSVPGVQTTSRRVPVTSTIVRPPATISTTSQATLTSPPQSASVSVITGHQVTTMQRSNNNFTASSAVLPSPSTSGRQPLNLFPDGATSTTAMSTTSTTNLSSPLQPITMDTTQQGTMQQTSSDSSTISSTTPSGPLPSGRPRRGSLPSDDLQDLDLPPDFDIEEFAKQIMKDDKK